MGIVAAAKVGHHLDMDPEQFPGDTEEEYYRGMIEAEADAEAKAISEAAEAEQENPCADCHGCENCQPCDCVQVDADEWNNRWCLAHGPKSETAHQIRKREADDMAAWYRGGA